MNRSKRARVDPEPKQPAVIVSREARKYGASRHVCNCAACGGKSVSRTTHYDHKARTAREVHAKALVEVAALRLQLAERANDASSEHALPPFSGGDVDDDMGGVGGGDVDDDMGGGGGGGDSDDGDGPISRSDNGMRLLIRSHLRSQ